jgi:heme oxygenase
MTNAGTASLRDQLRLETRMAHEALDGSLDLTTGRPLDLHQYARLLGRFHGFHQAIESRLAPLLEPALLAGRSKLPALRHDLRSCGIPDHALSQLPTIDALPPITGHAAALSAFYVAEGSTLGGRVIGRHVSSNPEIPSDACRYFNIYGDETGTRWRTVCSALDAASAPATNEQAVTTANAVFSSLQRWLEPSAWRNS